jgi:hypothetical protein
MSGHEPPHRSHCQNCGALLTGPYCAQCGQHDVDYNRSFWHIVEDALEGLLHFDGKFFRSARYIFTRPGFLTTEFIAGRRARYANPVRFYVFASFLFFAVSVLVGQRSAPTQAVAARPGTGVEAPEPREAREAAEPTDSKAAPGDHGGVSPDAADRRSWLEDPLRITSDPNDRVGGRALKEELWRLMPAMLFFCLPLLALVLKLAYIGSGRLYVEHLIFALHVQALTFLSFIAIRVGGSLGSLAGERVESAVGSALLLGMFLLIYRAFRAVYGQGRVKTAVKLVLVTGVYGLILIFAMVALVNTSTYLVVRGS